MDPLILVLTIAVSIVAVVMTVAGIQLIMTLHEARKTLRHVNSLVETLEAVAVHSIGSLAGLGGMMEGVKSGLRIAQSFSSWLNRDKER